MKNFSPLKRSISIALLLCVIAMAVGCLGMAISADTGSADDTAAVEEKADDTAESSEADLEAEAAKYSVNSSIWDTVAIPFGYIMRGCSFLTGGSYILALLLFAIAMKLVLFPFGIKQQKNSVKQARLRPKEQAIREKYAGRTDKVTQQKMQDEIMALYQRENFNPMGGCLPLLLQFPILFALFRVVYNPLRHVLGLTKDMVTEIGRNLIIGGHATSGELVYDINIINKLRNLSESDFNSVVGGISDKLTSVADLPKMTLFGLDLSKNPGNFNFAETIKTGDIWLLLIPILTFLSVFFSMKLTRKFTYQPTQQTNTDAGCSGKTMDFIMPLMSTFFAFMYPGVLGIYWVYQNLLGVVQQIALYKMFPLPVFTEEDYAAARKEVLGKEKKKKKSNGQKPRNPKSLHHIDDDDDDITAASDNDSGSGRTNSLLNGENLPEQKGAVPPAAMKEDIPAPEKSKDENK